MKKVIAALMACVLLIQQARTEPVPASAEVVQTEWELIQFVAPFNSDAYTYHREAWLRADTQVTDIRNYGAAFRARYGWGTATERTVWYSQSMFLQPLHTVHQDNTLILQNNIAHDTPTPGMERANFTFEDSWVHGYYSSRAKLELRVYGDPAKPYRVRVQLQGSVLNGFTGVQIPWSQVTLGGNTCDNTGSVDIIAAGGSIRDITPNAPGAYIRWTANPIVLWITDIH